MFCLYQCVNRNVNRNINERTAVTGLISFTLPVQSLISAYEMKPAAIPYEMEYVKLITEIVRKAGTAAAGSFQSMSITLRIISTPTYIRAPAVAQFGISAAIGLRNIATKNRTATTKEVNPVLPPSATPAEDSTKVVTVEVPSIAPVQVAIESHSNAF